MARLDVHSQKERDDIVRQMVDMKNSGKTYQTIADTFGISRQRVHQILSKGDERFFRHVTQKGCIYKGVRQYMNDNKICMTEMVRKVYGNYSPRNFYTLKNRLSGTVDPPKRCIDKILEITGLTYEVAFAVDSEV